MLNQNRKKRGVPCQSIHQFQGIHKPWKLSISCYLGRSIKLLRINWNWVRKFTEPFPIHWLTDHLFLTQHMLRLECLGRLKLTCCGLQNPLIRGSNTNPQTETVSNPVQEDAESPYLFNFQTHFYFLPMGSNITVWLYPESKELED